MSSCVTCKKKFTPFIPINKRLCKECGQYFCTNCLPYFTGNCKICKILNTRPVSHSCIMNIRSRELKIYLSKRKIQTENCIEKEDLVKCFLTYVALEQSQQKKKRTYPYSKYLNSNNSYSTPNLVTTNRTRCPTVDENSRSVTPPVNNTNNVNDEQPENPSVSGYQREEPEQNTTNLNAEQSLNSNLHSSYATTNLSAFSSELSPSAPVLEEVTADVDTNLSKIARIKLSHIKSATDIQILTIKQLKELLLINRVNFKGCVEKDELRSKVETLWIDSQNKEDVSGLPVDDLCKICMDAPLNCVLLECGHIATCIECGKQLAECPICRQYVVRVVHTFKA